ncbi:thioredoxin family protein [Sediminicoccus sp. KRV36]|uniref:thioredoxin family protein n=1 Tax=Sediminicoccus sp. KRV36 TaxID=3133721 RepID=UPI00200FA784|nr:thioredoxin family protein [Sediminicoccus rosea]UPY35582.1 thioredoxin family protein [Sediminicoccus rosea]
MPRLTRRNLLTGLALAPGLAHAAPVPTDNGFTQDWFHEGFLDLPEDLREATAEGKRLAVTFDQRGCPYCREMHTDHLTRPEIEGFVRPRFRIIQLDLHGARPVTDFDGTVLEERALARRWRVTFTPSFIFLPEQAPPRMGREIEVARMHGLMPKPDFLAMFTYVAEHGYAGGRSFRAWRERG